jgi:hypothetical protein
MKVPLIYHARGLAHQRYVQRALWCICNLPRVGDVARAWQRYCRSSNAHRYHGLLGCFSLTRSFSPPGILFSRSRGDISYLESTSNNRYFDSRMLLLGCTVHMAILTHISIEESFDNSSLSIAISKAKSHGSWCLVRRSSHTEQYLIERRGLLTGVSNLQDHNDDGFSIFSGNH